MAEEEQGEGLSTPKKVVAGAAIGVAVPAAVGVARKLMGGGSDDGDGEDDQQAQRDDDPSSEPTSRERGGSGRSASRAKSSSSRAKSTPSRSKTSSSRSKASSSATKKSSSSATRRTAPNRTREQLYRQATRLKIEGRSAMNKAQLERAIERVKAKAK